jgi:hypothetical protein
MILGIVGHEAAKFTPETEALARTQIRILMEMLEPEKVVSGACHLGGIDIWSIEEAKAFGIATEEFAPASRDWEGGYRPRNIRIAEVSDVVASIVVKEFPPGFTGRRFPYCYHCRTESHVKSGGCWTVKYARSLGKTGMIVEI